MNQYFGIGRITKDIEMKKTQSGQSVISFALAIDRDFKKDGNQTADFLNFQAWNKLAELINQYCHKGSLIAVAAHVQTRNYDGKDGRKVFVTEFILDKVKFLDPKGSNQQNTEPSYNIQNYQQNNDDCNYQSDNLDIQSDMLPF